MICLASDHGGVVYKEKLKAYLKDLGLKYKDFGTKSKKRCDAIDYCEPACREVLKAKNNKGIFICRSGLAMSIIANRFPGLRAVCAYDKKSVKSARAHSDVNILTTGADYISFNKFKKIVETFLNTPFSKDEVYSNRLKKLDSLKI